MSMGNNSPAPGRAHEHSYFITRSTNVTAIRLSVTISQPWVTLTKRAHRSRPPRLLQEEHGWLERGACSLCGEGEVIDTGGGGGGTGGELSVRYVGVAKRWPLFGTVP